MQIYNNGDCSEKYPKDKGTYSFATWLCMQELSKRDMNKKPAYNNKPTYNNKNYDYWQNLNPQNCRFKHFESETPKNFKSYANTTINGLPNYEEFERSCRKEYEEMQRSRQCECKKTKCCTQTPRTITGREQPCTEKVPPQCDCPPECPPPFLKTITGRENAPYIAPQNPPAEVKSIGFFTNNTDVITVSTGIVPLNYQSPSNLNMSLNEETPNEVTITASGTYEAHYSIVPRSYIPASLYLELAVNGEVIEDSAFLVNGASTNSFYLLSLNAGDKVSLYITADLAVSSGQNVELFLRKF